MIPRSTQTFCPRRLPINPSWKLSFRWKCYKSILAKVWGSNLNQYSMIRRSFCSKFYDNSIPARLKRSLVVQTKSRFSKNPECMLYSSSVGARRQRRQPLNQQNQQQVGTGPPNWVPAVYAPTQDPQSFDFRNYWNLKVFDWLNLWTQFWKLHKFDFVFVVCFFETLNLCFWTLKLWNWHYRGSGLGLGLLTPWV
jgi:hypothetical protein